jgi:Leucine-rich repeat (LRR) protein
MEGLETSDDELNCNDYQLTELPNMLNITTLNCSNNLITELPEMPNITTLNCSNNLINRTS